MLSLKTCHFGKMEVIFQKMEFTNSHFHHLEWLTVNPRYRIVVVLYAGMKIYLSGFIRFLRVTRAQEEQGKSGQGRILTVCRV